jgi:hypothetical protein
MSRKYVSLGFIEAFAGHVATLDLGYSTTDGTLTIGEEPADVFDLDEIMDAKSLLTVYDEGDTLTFGARVHRQERTVRVVRKGTYVQEAINAARELQDALVNRRRFSTPGFTAILRAIASGARLVTRRQDGTALAEVVLSYLVMNR